MTSDELAVSLVCTIVGYIVVTWLIKRDDQPERSPDDLSGQQSPPRQDAPARPPPSGPGAWHQVLGVPANARRPEITSAYRALISQYHPDKVSRLGPEIRAVAERKSAEINRAYEQALRSLPEFP